MPLEVEQMPLDCVEALTISKVDRLDRNEAEESQAPLVERSDGERQMGPVGAHHTFLAQSATARSASEVKKSHQGVATPCGATLEGTSERNITSAHSQPRQAPPGSYHRARSSVLAAGSGRELSFMLYILLRALKPLGTRPPCLLSGLQSQREDDVKPDRVLSAS
ncbi:hypothetical protein K490DRAFT_54314 [Saccharata proteae CBS 121410]|uniref:Uncharacterized protein n=1 Tax=Saccharata proteae CBS 121410 TaxID=1314787 RepID=A0A9P4HXY5_9PEZI|nr:hypothetical protein K490DRAFT_54314 [Saccharata proteae CBS 121410]